MKYYKATIEVLVSVEDEAEACDAVAETLRPLLNYFSADSCVIDWRYHPSHPVPVPDDGKAFEYTEDYEKRTES